MTHTHGQPYHPMTQGKIKRYHRPIKNQILLENYYLPCELEKRIGQFVHYYNTGRYHEGLDNLTPADVYFGQGEKILNWRAKIKKQMLARRRQLYYQQKAA
jgi:transposase InsO family protein